MNSIRPALKLREYRKQASLNQWELAELLGVSQTAVSRYECGLLKPSRETKKLLEKIFKVSAEELLSE